MGKQLHYGGESHDVPANETVQEFKQRVGIPEEDILTYKTDDMDLPQGLDDDETLDKVPDGATIGQQPPGDEIFG